MLPRRLMNGWNKGKLTGARPPLPYVPLKLNVRSTPEAALGGLEIQLPLYPRNRTQLGNRGMSEMCQ